MSKAQPWSSSRPLSFASGILLLEAAFWLCLARLVLVFVPFPRIARTLGSLHGPASTPETTPHRPGGEEAAGRIGWAVNRSARMLPFRAVCLPRALAAWQMLTLRGISARLHFGAARDPFRKALRSHAWLDACGVEVTGYPVGHGFVEIGYFARPPRG